MCCTAGACAVRLAVQPVDAARDSAARLRDVGYNRRVWGNHFLTDNRALVRGDFDVATMTAPCNPLPAGRGRPVPFVTRNSRTLLGAVDNYYTFAGDYGDVTTYWHGVNIAVTARLSEWVDLPGWYEYGSRRA